MIKLPNNSFSQLAKDDPFDRLDVEVGDTKQVDFFPQTKIMKWGNEVNLSVRLVDTSPGVPIVSQESEKVKWVKPDIESHFYEHPVSEEHPEGGFEFEVILKKKPASNVLQFTIQTKGLDFFYQPALTQKEIDEGSIRPENVVGSYAVYHSEKQGDYSQARGKNYRAGKAFHIYRPKVTDATGKEIWGELNIDTVSGILSVTIDQGFLDTALYPVAVDPTFGYTTGGSSSVAVAADAAAGSLFTSAAGSWQARSITADVYASPTTNIKALIALHSDLTIISNGVSSAKSIPTDSGAFYLCAFPTYPDLSASTDYILAIVPETASAIDAFYYDAGSADQGHLDPTNSYSSPTTLADITHSTKKFSIYCTYHLPQYDTSLRNTGATNPKTLSYTCGATANLLVLGIVTAGATIRTGGAPTYNGVTMTQADQDRSATETCAELWYLLDPPTGAAYNISVPNTGTKTVYLLASSYISSTGAYAYDTANGNVATSANPSVSVTTTGSNAVVVAVLGDGLDTAPTAVSHSSLWSNDNVSYSDNLQYTVQAAAGSPAMSWTVGSDDWAMCVGAWKEVVAGGGSNVGFFQLF